MDSLKDRVKVAKALSLVDRIPAGVTIEWVEWGVANNFTEIIEIHKDLLDHEDLLLPILKHEIQHFSTEGLAGDVWLDLVGSGTYRWKLFKFMMLRPKTWIQLLPFYYSPKWKQIIYDKSVMLFWAISLGLGGLIGGLSLWLL